ncbi:MAG: hypothetical protein JWM81_965 [Candidatus Saccharibacteria bacterium]|nr:hypothetical protein [Candidatus Saccharibacteria bacterium]
MKISHTSSNQSGFGTVELIAVIIVLAAILGVGAFVVTRHKDSSTNSSDTASKQSDSAAGKTENAKVFQAAHDYCVSIAPAGKTFSFFLNTSSDSPNKGISVVYSDNGTKARVDGACYDTATGPESSSVYPFAKDSEGNWSLDKTVTIE